MTDKQKQILAYVVMVVAVAIAAFLGAQYDLPPPPEVQTMAEGDTNFTNVVASGDVSVGSGVAVELFAAVACAPVLEAAPDTLDTADTEAIAPVKALIIIKSANPQFP